MDTTTARSLWLDVNGAVYCTAHGGNYLQSAVAANPSARHHDTPRGRWWRLTKKERADLAAILGYPTECEVCRGGWSK